ncbi:hypothetical protein ILYODFUR_038060, partial [Ilyodon furcidens]
LLLYVGLTLAILIFMLAAALLIFYKRKSSSQQKVGHGKLVPISSPLWVGGGVHPGQVASPSQMTQPFTQKQ